MLSLLYIGVKAQQYFIYKLELHVLRREKLDESLA